MSVSKNSHLEQTILGQPFATMGTNRDRRSDCPIGRKFLRSKEIEMFTKPVTKIFAVLLVLAVASITASFISGSPPASATDRSYDRVEQMRAARSRVDSSYSLIEQVRLGRTLNSSVDRSYDGLEQMRNDRLHLQTKERALREYQLGERYGEIPSHVAQFSAVQIHREYILGERYGVTPQGYAEQQALREYWLGEKYGQTP